MTLLTAWKNTRRCKHGQMLQWLTRIHVISVLEMFYDRRTGKLATIFVRYSFTQAGSCSLCKWASNKDGSVQQLNGVTWPELNWISIIHWQIARYNTRAESQRSAGAFYCVLTKVTSAVLYIWFIGRILCCKLKFSRLMLGDNVSLNSSAGLFILLMTSLSNSTCDWTAIIDQQMLLL